MKNDEDTDDYRYIFLIKWFYSDMQLLTHHLTNISNRSILTIDQTTSSFTAVLSSATVV